LEDILELPGGGRLIHWGAFPRKEKKDLEVEKKPNPSRGRAAEFRSWGRDPRGRRKLEKSTQGMYGRGKGRESSEGPKVGGAGSFGYQQRRGTKTP